MAEDLDARALLRRADALLKAGDAHGAVREYVRVARFYEGSGFALKATALWKQVREVIRTQLPSEREMDREARASLSRLFRALGLNEEAKAIEAEDGPS